MRFCKLAAFSLLLVPSLQAQSRLDRTSLTRALVAATVTIPALSFWGDMGGTRVSLGYDRISTAGYYLDLNGPTGGGGSSVTVSSNPQLPTGNYSVRFDFVNLGQPMNFNFTGTGGVTIGTCSLQAGPGYSTVQSCTHSFNFTGGYVLLSIVPTSGNQATLKSVTVTRFQ